MSVIAFPAHRCVPPAMGAAKGPDAERLTATYAEEGRDLADLAQPIVEPFRQCEPTLEQHLKGAFLRWQMDRIKDAHKDQPTGQWAIGLALAVTVEAFTNRMLELQGGLDPDDGCAA